MSKKEGKLEISISRQFLSWLAESGLSLFFTTYQTGKVFFIGAQDKRLSVFERTFNRCMGLYADKDSMWMSSLYQVWHFINVLEEGQNHNGYDALFVPKTGYTTGDLDIHDIALAEDGSPIFVNTLFSCLAKLSDEYSFEPIWKPKFISKLAAEDRCHLNGLAMKEKKPAYVTAVAKTDVTDAWRDHRKEGGIVIDVPNNEIVTEGLSMPHSPRWYKDTLWVLNSGNGEFGKVDLNTGKFEAITFCPGYLRGMTFHQDYAIVGTSMSRDNKTFSGLELDERLAQRNAKARCALYVINLSSGEIHHWLRLEGIVKELYDVVAVPGLMKPMALGFKTDEIQRMIKVPDDVN